MYIIVYGVAEKFDGRKVWQNFDESFINLLNFFLSQY